MIIQSPIIIFTITIRNPFDPDNPEISGPQQPVPDWDYGLPVFTEVRLLNQWRPITDEEFAALYAEQAPELNIEKGMCLINIRSVPWKAIIRRSEQAGDEHVFVVLQTTDGVLLFR